MIQEKHIDTALKELFGNLKFTEEPKGLYDPLRYMMEIGGKRIRPRRHYGQGGCAPRSAHRIPQMG